MWRGSWGDGVSVFGATMRTAKPRQTTREMLLLSLVVGYAFVVHFGVLFRVSVDRDSSGISTILAIAILILGLVPALFFILREPVYVLLVALLALLSFASGMSSPHVAQSLFQASQLGAYIVMSAAVAATIRDPKWLHRFWIGVIFGLAISAGLTIIDFLGILDVPRNNDLGISTLTSGGRVEQAGGFFFNRTAMAAVFVFGITGASILVIEHKHFLTRVKFAVAAGIGLLAIILTHNRSAVLSAAIAVLTYIVLSGRLRTIRKVKVLLGIVVAMIVCGILLWAYFPRHMAVYVEKLAFVSGSSVASESDESRIVLFKIAVRSLSVYPFGHGFTDVQYGLMESQRSSPHNIITGLLWGAGVLFIVWLPFFVFVVRQRLARALKVSAENVAISAHVDAVVYGLFAWLLHNMTHYSLSTGIVWVGLGLAMARYGEGVWVGSRRATRMPLESCTRWRPDESRTQDGYNRN